MEVKIRECLQCGHKWALRQPKYGEPGTCPKCGSPFWNKPKMIEKGVKNENAINN